MVIYSPSLPKCIESLFSHYTFSVCLPQKNSYYQEGWLNYFQIALCWKWLASILSLYLVLNIFPLESCDWITFFLLSFIYLFVFVFGSENIWLKFQHLSFICKNDLYQSILFSFFSSNNIVTNWVLPQNPPLKTTLLTNFQTRLWL